MAKEFVCTSCDIRYTDWMIAGCPKLCCMGNFVVPKSPGEDVATIGDMLDYWYRDQPSEYEKDFAVGDPWDKRLKGVKEAITKEMSDSIIPEWSKKGKASVKMDVGFKNPKYYSKYEIEPAEFIIKNGLGFAEGNVIKYICRYSEKGGRGDLEKAKEYIDLLIENRGL